MKCDLNTCSQTLQGLVSQTVYIITVAARNGAHKNNGLGNISTLLNLSTLAGMSSF